LIIKHGYIALPGEKSFLPLDIEIKDGKIVRTGPNLSGSDIFDAEGLLVFPGAIDPHVHFNDPGYTEREDFTHGSRTAASGGVTTVIDMPCTSVPPVTTLKNFHKKLDAVRNKSVVDFAFFGGVSGQCFENDPDKNISELAPHVVGFKTYFISGMETFHRLTFEQFAYVLKRTAKVKRPVLLHAEDYDTVTRYEAEERGKGSDWQNFYTSRPEQAELIAIKNAVDLAQATGGSLHIVHIGTAEAAEYLAGKPFVTGETCPHYLEFSCEDFEEIGGALKTTPVVKSPGNGEKLWKYLMTGILDFVTSDHAPAPASQKNTGSAWTDYSGIPGTGTLFPYLYSEGLVRRKMPLDRFLKVTSENAAKRYGLFDRKGSIEPGKDADLILLDPDKTTSIRGKDFYSKGKITPFEGLTFEGKIMKTLLRGQIIYDADKGITVPPGTGHFLQKG